MSSGNKRMTAAIAFGVGQRTAQWLRAQWPHDTAKNAARALQTEPRTVKTWLAGKPPSNEFFHVMAAKWGKAFIAFIYAPQFDWAEQARLEVEIETMAQSLEEIRAELRRRNGTTQNMAGDVRAMADRPAAQAKRVVESQNRKMDRSAS
jgi:hypothetical protein